MLDLQHFSLSPNSLVLWFATFWSLISAAPANPITPDIGDVQTHTPDALIPGSVTCALDRDPPGYLVCTLVTKYFDDESRADLQVELDLTARLQFVRYMTASSNKDIRRAEMTVRGFRNVDTWWEGDALIGFYFVPVDGLEVLGTDAGDATGSTRADADAPNKPSAAELLLEGRARRKRRDFNTAREVLGRLRDEYPFSPEARRALRELYFVSTTEKQLAPLTDGAQ